MGKGGIALGIVVIVALVLAIAFFMLTSSSTVVAMLHVQEGTVQTDTGHGWTTVNSQAELSEKDSVRTLDNGRASLILYESVVITLEPNTELAIKELTPTAINVHQQSGSTWNKFTGLAGIEELTVETPTTVATVRGTSFEVSMDYVTVAEGVVEVSRGGQTVKVRELEKAEVSGAQLELKRASSEDKKRMVNNIESTIKELRSLRWAEIQKHKFILNQVKEMYGVTDQDIDAFFLQAESGELDLKELQKKFPFQIDAVDKVREITEEIIEEKVTMERLQASGER